MLGVLQNSFLVWVSNNRIGGFYGKLWGVMEQHLNFTYVEDTAGVAQIITGAVLLNLQQYYTS